MAHNTHWFLAAFLTATGSISLFSCASTRPAPHPRHLTQRQQFDLLDTDKDGKLSYAELMKAPLMRKFSDPGTLFTRMDSNSDGSISLAEFHDYRLKNKRKP